jgi:AbrB family looped-hinge helix DNA binding protein
MNVSKLSVKGQVTIPKEVREKLGVKPGDWIAYELENGTVSIRRVEPFDADFHGALTETMHEWNSKEDDEAFRDL